MDIDDIIEKAEQRWKEELELPSKSEALHRALHSMAEHMLQLHQMRQSTASGEKARLDLINYIERCYKVIAEMKDKEDGKI